MSPLRTSMISLISDRCQFGQWGRWVLRHGRRPVVVQAMVLALHQLMWLPQAPHCKPDIEE